MLRPIPQTLLLTLALAWTVAAAESAWPATVPVGDMELQQIGHGTLKWKRLFRVCTSALYLPPGIEPGRWADDVPKQLTVRYHVAIKGSQLTQATRVFWARNVAEAEQAALAERLAQLEQLHRDVRSGDRYTITYRPGSGTELALNGQILGTIPGADFSAAYLRIWLGERPMSPPLRKALLGQARD